MILRAPRCALRGGGCVNSSSASGLSNTSRSLSARAPLRDGCAGSAIACRRYSAAILIDLPDITRCAASATASAISKPSLVALAIMLLAASEALLHGVEAGIADPRGRCFRARADCRPLPPQGRAASISLLIAALASFSSPYPCLKSFPEELLLEKLAIASASSLD